MYYVAGYKVKLNIHISKKTPNSTYCGITNFYIIFINIDVVCRGEDINKINSLTEHCFIILHLFTQNKQKTVADFSNIGNFYCIIVLLFCVFFEF